MLLAAQASPANVLGRRSEPVILTGVRLLSRTGVDALTLLTFGHGGAWAQTPGRHPVERLDAAFRVLLFSYPESEDRP